jgi:hypothetical protein
MEDFQKLLWTRNGSNIQLGIDTMSVQKEGRIVIGFATLDNVDFAGDIITNEASMKAFSEFRGNVRVQHDKAQPVGRVLAFQPATHFDEKTQKTYRGIQVAVYVSKGAENIWQMCLDGTLSGFSIAGAVRKASKVFNEELGKPVQVIEDIMLTELSLVDSPMNGLANVYSIHKSLNYDIMEKDFNSFNLFWCATDRLASKLQATDANCPNCGDAMANFGHIEENADVQKQLEKVFEISGEKGGHPQVADSTNNDIEKVSDGEEVVSLEESVVEGADVEAPEVTEEAETVSEETAEAVEETDESNSEEVSEDNSDADAEADNADIEDNSDEAAQSVDVEALVAQFREMLQQETELSKKGHSELAERLETIEKNMTDLSSHLEKLKAAQDEVSEKLNKVSDGLEETEKRLDGVAGSTAFKKSLDSQNKEKNVNATDRKHLMSGVFTKGLNFGAE